MTAITRRSIVVASLIVPVVQAPAFAVDALPDARFVGFAQAVNDFDLGSGQMALQRSANENIRGYATRIIADANYDASALRLSSAEAGVSYGVVDVLSDRHLAIIGEAIADHPLITGGSGVALGLPENFRRVGLLGERAEPMVPAVEGRAVVLAGSCSARSRHSRSEHVGTRCGPMIRRRGVSCPHK